MRTRLNKSAASQRGRRGLLGRLGLPAVLFFTFKGLAWLLIGGVAAFGASEAAG